MKFQLITDHPVAVDSLDHIYPSATAKDNSKNPEFDRRLFELFPGRKISVLDLGCAGGGMVKTIIDAGHTAVGLEGSDYSKKIRRAEWATIPDNLFTCDITQPFTLTTDGAHPYLFDVVTAWEFFEHIEMVDLDVVMDNINKHLQIRGLLIASISGDRSIGKFGVDKHRTVMEEEWWFSFFTDKYKYKDRRELYPHFHGHYVHKTMYIFILEKKIWQKYLS